MAMNLVDPVDTPMWRSPKLDEVKDGKVVDPSPTIVARPIEKHLNEVKRIFRYLKGTIHWGLWYPKDSSFALTSDLQDADHAGCQDTRRSTSGSIQNSWDDRLVAGRLKGRKRARYPVRKLNILLLSVVVLKSKHIDIRFHFIKEHVENGVIELYFVNTEYQLADIFIKALVRERNEFLINKLGMQSFVDSEVIPGRQMSKPQRKSMFILLLSGALCQLHGVEISCDFKYASFKILGGSVVRRFILRPRIAPHGQSLKECSDALTEVIAISIPYSQYLSEHNRKTVQNSNLLLNKMSDIVMFDQILPM
ncbi:hypothetical protein Tco_0242653 [Tanacetum coccineum]